MSEAQPTPEKAKYTREDYLNMSWEVLYSGKMYDEYLPHLADDLNSLVSGRKQHAARYHGVLDSITKLHSEVVDRASQQAAELVDELNYGIKTYGAVTVRVEGEGDPVDMPVDNFVLGEQLGDIYPVVAGQPLTVEDYSIPWSPDDEKLEQ